MTQTINQIEEVTYCEDHDHDNWMSSQGYNTRIQEEKALRDEIAQ